MQHDPATAKSKSAIAGLVYSRASPASPVVPLGVQAPLAFILLLLAAVSGGLLYSTSSLKHSSLYALLTSVFLSFGAIFLVDAVRVYTG